MLKRLPAFSSLNADKFRFSFKKEDDSEIVMSTLRNGTWTRNGPLERLTRKTANLDVENSCKTPSGPENAGTSHN